MPESETKAQEKHLFDETTLTLLSKQFAMEEGWSWESLPASAPASAPQPTTADSPWPQEKIKSKISSLLRTFAPEHPSDSYFKRSTEDVGATVRINGELVERYMREGNLDSLLSLFNFLMRCRERAEYLSRAYLAQIARMQAPNASATTMQQRITPGDLPGSAKASGSAAGSGAVRAQAPKQASTAKKPALSEDDLEY